MILATATSKNNVVIRLTIERWYHITTSHKEIDQTDFSRIISTVESPEVILKGDTGELLAVRKEPRKKFWIVVAYKEVDSNDGFILTTYITTDSGWLFQKEVIWSK